MLPCASKGVEWGDDVKRKGMTMGPDINDLGAHDDVVLKRKHVSILADVILNALFLMIFLIGLWGLWTGIPHLRFGIPWTSLVAPFLIMLMGAVPLPVLMWAFIHDLLEGEIVIEPDRLRTMRKGRVVRELAFDGETWGTVYFHKGLSEGGLDDVRIYKFSRGWWGTIAVTEDDYSREDLRRIWPVVRAAVMNEGLRPSDRLRHLIQIEDG